MVARMSITVLLLQALVIAGIALAAIEVFNMSTVAALLLGVGVMLFVRMLVTANNFHLSWRFRSETPEEYRVSLWQACKLFFTEFRATMIASSINMPFFPFVQRMAPDPSGLPVLLVHGYGCNSGYWHSMSNALLKAGISHRAVNMEPVTCGIDDYVPLIDQALDALCRESGSQKVVIVGHSMGGLAARAYVRKHGFGRIAKVITLGTPHRGTGIARFGVGLNCRQMHWTADGEEGVSSEWLRELAAGENQDTYARFASIYSHHDNIIAPQTSSRLPGATNIEVYGIGHVALSSDPAVQANVIAEIRNASELAAEERSTPAT